MATKYIIPFYDVDGNSCSVSFDIDGYSGEPIKLIGGATPLVISYNGDQSDIFQQIINSKATITVDYHKEFLADTRDIDDKSMPVTILYGKGLKWVGFLIADQRIETFDRTGYDVELTAVDPFSYLKNTGNRIISTGNLYGLQRIYDIIKGVMDTSIEMPVNEIVDIAPWVVIGGTGQIYQEDGLFKDVLMRVETFMDDGLLMSGYDIISAICDIFCLTAYVFNGATTFIQAGYVALQETHKLYISDRIRDEWIEGNETVTRTRGVKQLGVKQEYTEDMGGSVIDNSYFYFLNPSNVLSGIVNGWELTSYPAYPELTVTTPEIKKDDFKGIIINGLVRDAVLYPPPASLTPTNFPHFLSSSFGQITGNNGYAHLKLKYKYHAYDQTQPEKYIRYGFHIIAYDVDGRVYSAKYSGNGGRLEVNTWVYIGISISLDQNMPQIVFPLAANETEQTFELSVDLAGFAGDPQYQIILWPLQRGGVNADFVGDHTSAEDSIPAMINITECSFGVDIWFQNQDEQLTSTYRHLFNYDETNIRNTKNYSEVKDTLSLRAGIVYGAGNTYANPKARVPWTDINQTLSVMLSGVNTAIERWVMNVATYSGGYVEKLITGNARERMKALRYDRYQVQVDIKSSSLKFTEPIEMPEVIDGVFIQVGDEYDVKNCIHTLDLIEYKGSNEESDIVENNLIAE